MVPAVVPAGTGDGGGCSVGGNGGVNRGCGVAGRQAEGGRRGMMSNVHPRSLFPAAALGLAAAFLAACTSTATGTPTPSTATGTERPSASLALSTVSFCVGSSPQHPGGSTVTVHFLRGSQSLGEPSVQVPMRVSVEVPPGDFRVVVDGATQFTGSTAPGETVKGSMGQGCPG
jgi:hypothetical protein